MIKYAFLLNLFLRPKNLSLPFPNNPRLHHPQPPPPNFIHSFIQSFIQSYFEKPLLHVVYGGGGSQFLKIDKRGGQFFDF